MRLRPRALPADVAHAARALRAFLAIGHAVVLEHLLRAQDRPLDEERLARHYELIAEELRGLPWLARGPFVAPHRVHVVFLALPLSGVQRYQAKLDGRRAERARVRVRLDPERPSEERAAALEAARAALVAGRIVTLTHEGEVPALAAATLGPFPAGRDAVQTLLLPAQVAELMAGRGGEGS